MFNNYYNEAKYIVDAFSFQYRGGYYSGKGTLRWKPETGFHLEGFIERHGDPIPKKYGIGEVGVIPEADFRTIRMRLQHNGVAVAPRVRMIQKHSLFTEMHLDIPINRVIFINQAKRPLINSNWFGSGFYKVGSRLLLPDSEHREEKINGETIRQGFSMAGLLFEEKGNQKIVGYLDKDRELMLMWSLDKTKWNKGHSWSWPEAASQALSILLGENIRLLQREIFKEKQRAIEINRQTDVESLDILRLFDQDYIDKLEFIHLTEFLVRDAEKGRICTNLFNQVLEASRQNNWQATELFLSTALEATLRSIDKVPFKTKKSKNKQWEIKASLKNFGKKYLSDEWSVALDKVLQAYFRLRDKNAHPDWLIGTGGALSDKERENSLDDMVLLSRFYGYMILALSGKKDQKPVFPRPHREWRPALTVEEIE